MTMKKKNTILIWIIALLAAGVSIYGIFSNQPINVGQSVPTIHGDLVTLYGKGLYHNESLSMAAQVRAQDMVTLFLGVPFLLSSLYLSNKDSIKGKFLLTGVLGYFLYTYATYCFVAMYNNFFLLFTLLMGLSFFAFVINLSSLNAIQLNQYFSKMTARKYVSCSIILFGFAIGLMWLGRLFPALSGGVPEGLEHYTTLPIQALDLGIVVPAMIISGFSLLKEKKLGYLLAPVMIIKGITLLLAVDAMAISMLISGAEVSPAELIVFPLFTGVFCFNLYLMMKGVNTGKQSEAKQLSQ
ncbi:hypothetical protein JZO70_11925 [Enterococcus sp. 669A]|uniref:Uncharacterized protein n=1 Tax=Candidatus Enterococcus moelleringii TaxID=2815325 RepID=A0ABS3LB57_9ENTE|nr:hypothetical protein [Enterococcus sp. 669A]MBO1306875.1 hypothetical protein [Enterococcus sp. 669A]